MVLQFSQTMSTLHSPIAVPVLVYVLLLIFQDILLRDQDKASGGVTKAQKEIVQQHISHRLRFSLRVGFVSFCSLNSVL